MGESRHTSSSNKTDYYYTLDHLGSIREMLNSTGTIQVAYNYTPFGTRTKVAGSTDVDFGFTGHWNHEESGLYLTHYRAYDSSLGRWLSTDPIGVAGGINLYSYVKNMSTMAVDRLGLALSALGDGNFSARE